MRIGMLSWESLYSISVGGVAAHVSELAEAMARRGHDLHVFTRRAAGQSAYDRIGGVSYHRCQYPPHDDFVDDVNNMCRAFVDRFFEVEDFVGPFDIVHAHDWLAANAMIWIKQGRPHRTVFTVHSTEYGRCGNSFPGGRSDRIRMQERAGADWADDVIAVSHATKKEVTWMYETPSEKVKVIYNGVTPGRFHGDVDPGGVKRRYGIGPTDPVVLFCGRLTWQKGPDLLVEAAPHVLRSHPHVKFVFAGDGDMRPDLEGRVRQLGVADAFRFVGVQSGLDLVRLFQMCDAVCVPSRNEPFGIVVLEAWSAGKPVIASVNGGPNEFVEHERTGLKIDPRVDSVAWGIAALVADFERARAMGRAGRRTVAERFTWDIIAERTLGLYGVEAAQAPARETERIAKAQPVVLSAAVKASQLDGLPATLPGVYAASSPARAEPSLQFCISARLAWRPRGAGMRVRDAIAACKRVLRESGLHVTFSRRAAKVEGRWDAVLDAIRRCFELVDVTGESQIVATILPPAPPLEVAASQKGPSEEPHAAQSPSRATAQSGLVPAA